MDKLRFFLTEEARAQGVTFVAPRLGDAGFDIRSVESVVVPPGKQAVVLTGLHLSIPVGWVGIVKDRSSMAQKRIYTHGGVIDASYRGEVKVVISNAGTESYHIQPNDKIAQMVIVAHLGESIEVGSIDELGGTTRGAGGFGSTGR